MILKLVQNSIYGLWNINNYFVIDKVKDVTTIKKKYKHLLEKPVYNPFLSVPKHITIVLDVSHSCPVGCKYCFVNPLDVREERANEPLDKNSINKLLKFIKSFDGEVVLIFHGAEPLTRKEIIKSIVEKIKQNDIKNVKLELQTSGFGLDTDFLDFVKLNNIEVGISFDGFSQNSARPPKFAIHGIKQLEVHKIKYGLIYIVNSTNQANIFRDFVKLTKLKYLRGILFNVVETSIKELIPDLNVVKKQIHKIMKYYVNHRLNIAITPISLYAERLLGYTASLCYDENCGGLKWIVGYSDGKFYPCDTFMGLKKFELSRWNNEQRRNIIRNKVIRIAQKISTKLNCDQCKYNYICRHPCVGKSFLTDFNSVYYSCKYNQIWLDLFAEYVNMNPALIYFFAREYKSVQHSDLFYIMPPKLINEFD